jgi:hypothetical protein
LTGNDGSRPLQHFEIAVGIAQGRDRAADEIHFRQSEQLRLAVA